MYIGTIGRWRWVCSHDHECLHWQDLSLCSIHGIHPDSLGHRAIIINHLLTYLVAWWYWTYCIAFCRCLNVLILLGPTFSLDSKEQLLKIQNSALQATLVSFLTNTFSDRCLPVSPKPDSPKLGFRARVRVSFSANRVSANRDWTLRSDLITFIILLSHIPAGFRCIRR